MANLHRVLLLTLSQFVPVRAQVLTSAIPLVHHDAVSEISMKKCRVTKTSRSHEGAVI